MEEQYLRVFEQQLGELMESYGVDMLAPEVHQAFRALISSASRHSVECPKCHSYNTESVSYPWRTCLECANEFSSDPNLRDR